jgi:hypothetical protein
MPIGQCEHCGQDILAPYQTLVWTEDHTFHQDCYRAHLERLISEEVVV